MILVVLCTRALPILFGLDGWDTDRANWRLTTVVNDAAKCGEFILILFNSNYYFYNYFWDFST